MRDEYELQTDVLATIVAAVPVTPKHAQLLTEFATRTDYRTVTRIASPLSGITFSLPTRQDL
ncbi:hypothetical protein [Burkholderia vietnamiensis]|uniref:hypothetical protein n=1 Tax=Burkholderia vietnamiensis TaxID=60552 RepID=UPI001B975D02|nr:hypothetical protein [Burkholderia vietnamiensis]MBR8206786.1 hypothetical protein [Burkholderia vietnamiensis]MCA8395594.1 hypothetical protein [Burkholderia vietnamiensis]MDN8035771.1 hypothetical protein [Burkholderia vietnamiensis]HDR8962075.1 hypothetical protein [Burkholderia vietnamiensis]HDR9247817.1 hypothetical protein [Burkholderia vietnamiensis]